MGEVEDLSRTSFSLTAVAFEILALSSLFDRSTSKTNRNV